METPNYNSNNTPAISSEVTTAEPETNEEMTEAHEATEHAWDRRQKEVSETSDG